MHMAGNGGRFSVYEGFSGEERAYMGVLSSGEGYIETEGENGNNNITLSTLSGYANHGYVSVQNSSGNNRAGMYVNSSAVGRIFVSNSSGTRSAMTVLSGGQGYIETVGANGNDNVRLTTLSGYSNNGYVSVLDANGTTQAGIYVNSSGQGIVFGDTKSFRMPNPDDAATEIWYASLEGPEAAAYIRGTAQLVNGQATITFPDHFLAVASEQDMTIQLTPLSADSLGLAVVEKSLTGVEVKELHNGSGTYKFDFMVTAVRQGYEDYKVIRPAAMERSAVNGSDENLDSAVEGNE